MSCGNDCIRIIAWPKTKTWWHVLRRSLPPIGLIMRNTPLLILPLMYMTLVISIALRCRWWRRPVLSGLQNWLRCVASIMLSACYPSNGVPRQTRPLYLRWVPFFPLSFRDPGFWRHCRYESLWTFKDKLVSGRWVAWLKVTFYSSIKSCGLEQNWLNEAIDEDEVLVTDTDAVDFFCSVTKVDPSIMVFLTRRCNFELNLNAKPTRADHTLPTTTKNMSDFSRETSFTCDELWRRLMTVEGHVGRDVEERR